MSTVKDSSTVAIIGSGLIGQSWAAIFVGAGYKCCLFDVDAGQLPKALSGVRDSLARYEESGSLRGKGSAAEQADRVTGTGSLEDCLNGAFYVQECVPESLELKKKVFAELDHLVANDVVVASSSSCLCASMFAEGLQHRANMLVAHPVNPPYFTPLVEIVPAPFTSPDVTQRVRNLMEEIGQSPVTLKREALGFALNRIQYAVINECWNMYQTGLLNAQDIDKVCHDGLGLRYAFIGPLETMHLNANGIKDYCERYASGAYKVQKELFKPIPVMYDIETAEKIEAEFQPTLPVEKLQERRQWRDLMLAGLAKFKGSVKEPMND